MWGQVPWRGIEPEPLYWKRGVLATGPPGKSHRFSSPSTKNCTTYQVGLFTDIMILWILGISYPDEHILNSHPIILASRESGENTASEERRECPVRWTLPLVGFCYPACQEIVMQDSLHTVATPAAAAAAAAKSLQSCLTLCDPIDSSPPGSSVHGIL